MRERQPPDELADLVRSLAPQVLSRLLRRGEEFAAAEDAIQEAVVEALRVWPAHPPRDPLAWLHSVAVRRLVDARRSESARRARDAWPMTAWSSTGLWPGGEMAGRSISPGYRRATIGRCMTWLM